jgi:hypothetical protein
MSNERVKFYKLQEVNNDDSYSNTFRTGVQSESSESSLASSASVIRCSFETQVQNIQLKLYVVSKVSFQLVCE